jgi:hypothetical protein
MANSSPITELFILAIPIATLTWTFTHEEVLKEVREHCERKKDTCPRLYQRKFYYLFTCEYCLSHYVTAAFLILTRYKLLYGDWRGYLISEFALVWVANIYMSIYGRVRLGIKRERVELTAEESLLKEEKEEELPSREHFKRTA